MFHWSGFPANFTIPSVYDETLDYETQLARIIRCLIEMKKYIESLPEELGNYVDNEILNVKKWANANILKPLTDMINGLEDELDKSNALTKDEIKRLDDLIKELDKSKADIVYVDEKNMDTMVKLKKYVDNNIIKLDTKLENAIVDLMKYSDNNLYTAKRYADSLLVVAKAYADIIRTDLLQVISDAERSAKKYSVIQTSLEKMERMLEDAKLNRKIDALKDRSFPVYNIPRGKKTSVQQAITDLYVGLRPFALQNNHLADAKITYEEIEKLGLSWFEWDVYNGYIVKHIYDKVFSPISGRRMTLYDCLCELTNVLRWNSKTVDWWEKHTVPPSEAELNGVSIFDWTFTRKILTSDIGERINLLLTTSQTLWMNDQIDSSTITVYLPDEGEYTELEILYTGLEGGVCSKIIHISNNSNSFMITGQKSMYNPEDMSFSIYSYQQTFVFNKEDKSLDFKGTDCLVNKNGSEWEHEKVNDMFVPVKVINKTKHDSILSLRNGFID